MAKDYLPRLPRERGVRRDIDENGDLLVRRMGKVEVERKALLPLLADAVVARSENARAARVKLLRTIRLDPSDTFVFERAAEPGEWAVSGAFVFWNADPAQLRRQGARGVPRRLLGVESLGWSTLVQIVEASDDDRAALVERWRSNWWRSSARPISRRRGARPRRRSPSPRRSAIIRSTR